MVVFVFNYIWLIKKKKNCPDLFRFSYLDFDIKMNGNEIFTHYGNKNLWGKYVYILIVG